MFTGSVPRMIQNVLLLVGYREVKIRNRWSSIEQQTNGIQLFSNTFHLVCKSLQLRGGTQAPPCIRWGGKVRFAHGNVNFHAQSARVNLCCQARFELFQTESLQSRIISVILWYHEKKKKTNFNAISTRLKRDFLRFYSFLYRVARVWSGCGVILTRF